MSAELLAAAAGPVAPAAGLFLPELHNLKNLRGDQVAELAASCSTYTEEITSLFADIFRLAREVQAVLNRPHPLSKAEVDEAMKLVAEHADLIRRAGEFFVRALVGGRKVLDDDQIRQAADIRAQIASRFALDDRAVPVRF
jgi:hypothetical protein